MRGEAEEVKRLPLRFPFLPATRTTKGHEACLVGMQREAKPLHPLPGRISHPLGVVAALEGDHEVVRITDEPCAPLEPRLHLVLEPSVEHMVEVDVPEK